MSEKDFMQGRVKLNPRVREEVVKAAKIKAIQTGITLEGAIELLLSMWAEGKVELNFGSEELKR